MSQGKTQPFVLPNGAPLTTWRKVLDLAVESSLTRSGELMAARPPVAAEGFAIRLGRKALAREDDRPLLARLYRKVRSPPRSPAFSRPP